MAKPRPTLDLRHPSAQHIRSDPQIPRHLCRRPVSLPKEPHRFQLELTCKLPSPHSHWTPFDAQVYTQDYLGVHQMAGYAA